MKKLDQKSVEKELDKKEKKSSPYYTLSQSSFPDHSGYIPTVKGTDRKYFTRARAAVITESQYQGGYTE